MEPIIMTMKELAAFMNSRKTDGEFIIHADFGKKEEPDERREKSI